MYSTTTTNSIFSDHRHVSNRLSYKETQEALQCAQKIMKYLTRHEDNGLRDYKSNIETLRGIIGQHMQNLDELRQGTPRI